MITLLYLAVWSVGILVVTGIVIVLVLSLGVLCENYPSRRDP